jgi:hypothetical protein
MPFGLKNAPATCQKLMTRVLEGYLGKFAQVYLDDIIIFSRDHTEHLVHLRLILESGYITKYINFPGYIPNLTSVKDNVKIYNRVMFFKTLLK